MIILSIDYGTKILGLALAETTLCDAMPIKSIPYKKKNFFWNELKYILNTWNPIYIILGYPYHIKKKIQKKIKKFKKKIEKKFNQIVILHDENYSSTEAKQFFKNKKNKKKYCIHSISAKIILDSWLEKEKIC